MPRPISIVLTLRDATGRDTQLLIDVINQDVEGDISIQLEMARQFQLDVDALTDAQVVACGLVVDVPLDPGLKAAAVPPQQHNEGAVFVFQSSTGHNTSTRIPAVNESKFIPGTPVIDVADTDVQNFINNVIDGYTVASIIRDVTDTRGADITSLLNVRKSFNKPRI